MKKVFIVTEVCEHDDGEHIDTDGMAILAVYSSKNEAYNRMRREAWKVKVDDIDSIRNGPDYINIYKNELVQCDVGDEKRLHCYAQWRFGIDERVVDDDVGSCNSWEEHHGREEVQDRK